MYLCVPAASEGQMAFTHTTPTSSPCFPPSSASSPCTLTPSAAPRKRKAEDNNAAASPASKSSKKQKLQGAGEANNTTPRVRRVRGTKETSRPSAFAQYARPAGAQSRAVTSTPAAPSQPPSPPPGGNASAVERLRMSMAEARAQNEGMGTSRLDSFVPLPGPTNAKTFTLKGKPAVGQSAKPTPAVGPTAQTTRTTTSNLRFSAVPRARRTKDKVFGPEPKYGSRRKRGAEELEAAANRIMAQKRRRQEPEEEKTEEEKEREEREKENERERRKPTKEQRLLGKFRSQNWNRVNDRERAKMAVGFMATRR